MSKQQYFLFFKTGDAELRALENIPENKRRFIPIIELTRGRKSKIDTVGIISKRLNKLESLFKDKVVLFDLTTDINISSDEINSLYEPINGYQAWTEFLIEQKNKNIYKDIIPNILVDIDDPELSKNLKKQIKCLAKEFKAIAYRNNIADDGCYDDIDNIKDIINNTGRKLYFIIDCDYIPPLGWPSYADKIKIRIRKILEKIKDTKFVIISTSFPKNVSDYGDEETATFRLNEIDLVDEIVNCFSESLIKYGDYGSINPKRNDTIKMLHGWVPRIDIPLKNEIYYYKKRIEKNKYSKIYSEVASQIIRNSRFPILMDNWGIEQVKSCSRGNSPGTSPSFWISVRMNIHIEQQLIRLGLI